MGAWYIVQKKVENFDVFHDIVYNFKLQGSVAWALQTCEGSTNHCLHGTPESRNQFQPKQFDKNSISM